ncbi:TonB-dependent receptor [Bizionia argentinensis JUB59]|uniref:TonB-dependent receptor n=1 Tax=Bizionia argentinensis JUB59 TaxID=1046627 RepID=G2EA43_9FLAO|nr:outer membrane beta-barrel protein [Bizionia argentinensis]EGV44711.2 TonB-dependent receptor [Bizionia argentinensis JUB59]
MKNLFFIVAFLCISISFSQSKSIEISGKIIAADDQLPLESATVHLERLSDSTVINYTISDREGRFLLEDRISDKSVKMYVSYIGYKTYVKTISLSNPIIKLENIKMEVSNALDEVLIKSSAPITIKKDTLEFNVSSFKTKKDASVEDLLKELPGVEVDEDGKIKINGKEVNKILVNGKPFFGDDPTITTKNLTKELIEKVQIVDTKTKAEAFTGEDVDGESKTINLTIKEENNKGVFGRVAGGVGTNDRYEGAGMLNYFDNDRRISVLAGTNNINSPGFSFGEIRKMFGGGSNMSMSNNGSFSIDGRSFGGGQGITKSRNAGLNFADKIGEKTDVAADYFYSGSTSENETASQRENILPDSRYFTNSTSKSYNDTNSHSANMGFDIEIDSTFLINIDPSFRYVKSTNTYDSDEESLNDQNVLTNNSNANSYIEDIGKNFRNNINITKKFGDKGAFVRVNVTNEINTRESEDYLTSLTNVYGKDVNDPNNPEYVLLDQTERDQLTNGEGDVNTFRSSINYRLPLIAEALFLDFDYNYDREKSMDTKSTYDKDGQGDYSMFNEDLSTDFEYLDESMTPGVSISYSNKIWSANFGFNYVFRTLGNTDLLRSELTIKKRFESPELKGYLRYKFSPKVSFWSSYSMRSSPPRLSQLQAFQNVSNPLNTIVGNPDLSPSNDHRISLGFNAFDWQKRTGFYAYIGGDLNENQVVNKTTVDDDFVSTTTYANVDGNYNAYASLNYSKDFKLDSIRTIKASIGMTTGQRRNINFNNDVQYASKRQSLSPKAELRFIWKNVMEFRPRYSISFTKNKYDLPEFEDRNFLYLDLSLSTALFLPKKFEWRNDVNFNYNPNIGPGFQKSAWFWNSTLAYSVLKDAGTVTLKVYDLLNQNTNARRTATQNYIQDSQSTVLEQYFMLSFSWKFNSLGSKGETKGNDVFYSH